jgi:5-formyltetrahydrofolate cyclo-ligase
VTTPPEPPPSKAALRRAARAARARIGAAEAREAAARLAERFFASLAPPPAAVIAGYWPVHGEIDARAILETHRCRGGRTALPAVETLEAPLVFRAWNGETPGDVDALGMACTGGEALVPQILLVPLLAFDRRGHRLGYGSGYYDRTLAALRAAGKVTAVGVGFAAQEAPALAAEAHDAHLDWIVTEAFAFPVAAA